MDQEISKTTKSILKKRKTNEFLILKDNNFQFNDRKSNVKFKKIMNTSDLNVENNRKKMSFQFEKQKQIEENEESESEESEENEWKKRKERNERKHSNSNNNLSLNSQVLYEEFSLKSNKIHENNNKIILNDLLTNQHKQHNQSSQKTQKTQKVTLILNKLSKDYKENQIKNQIPQISSLNIINTAKTNKPLLPLSSSIIKSPILLSKSNSLDQLNPSFPLKNKENQTDKWKKLKTLILGIVKFQKMSKNIQLFGETDGKFNINKLKRIQNSVENKENPYDNKKNMSFLPIPVFHPDSHIMIFWNIIIGFMMAYGVIITPYKLAYIEDSNDFLNTFDDIVNYFFIIDIIVNFNLSISKGNKTETRRKKIAVNYLKTWFILDVLASFPIDLIINSSQTKPTHQNRMIRLVRFSKLSKLSRLFRIVKISRFFKRISFINAIQDYFNINYGISRLITFIISFFILTHIIGCLWYFLPLLYDDTNNWVIHRGIIDESNFTKYINSVYWAMTTVTTCGFGDISAKNDVEYVISLVWILFGVFFYSFTIGTLSTILVNMNTKSNLMAKKLSIINTYSAERKLSNELSKEIKRVLIYNSNTNLFSWIEKQEIFENLPANLKCSIAESMREGYLKNVHFFQKKEDGFISMIVPNLHSIVFHSTEFIYKKGESPSFIYFIIQGRVSFLTCFNVIFKVYVKGSYFGEYEIIKRLKHRKNSLLSDCNGNVEVLTLSRIVYERIILNEYPEVHKEMKIISKIRFKKLVFDEILVCSKCKASNSLKISRGGGGLSEDKTDNEGEGEGGSKESKENVSKIEDEKWKENENEEEFLLKSKSSSRIIRNKENLMLVNKKIKFEDEEKEENEENEEEEKYLYTKSNKNIDKSSSNSEKDNEYNNLKYDMHKSMSMSNLLLTPSKKFSNQSNNEKKRYSQLSDTLKQIANRFTNHQHTTQHRNTRSYSQKNKPNQKTYFQIKNKTRSNNSLAQSPSGSDRESDYFSKGEEEALKEKVKKTKNYFLRMNHIKDKPKNEENEAVLKEDLKKERFSIKSLAMKTVKEEILKLTLEQKNLVNEINMILYRYNKDNQDNQDNEDKDNSVG